MQSERLACLQPQPALAHSKFVLYLVGRGRGRQIALQRCTARTACPCPALPADYGLIFLPPPAGLEGGAGLGWASVRLSSGRTGHKGKRDSFREQTFLWLWTQLNNFLPKKGVLW